MDILKFDLQKPGAEFKILNATNGGPFYERHKKDQLRSNFSDYKAARIPYSRNHDSAAHQVYGGPYSHDISCIFPNFDADEYSPESYDFACTDESILACLDAGTETFFRLGQTIEHQIKKHATLPPKDFKKWAVICEHIIRHYNEGWANGYELGIEYWEIWNEPDLDEDDSDNKRTWGGTKKEFFELYKTAALHLKGCFPHLKIGGPAIAGWIEWADEFLCEMQKADVPIDFFSWHIYCVEPKEMLKRAYKVQEIMEKYGYGDAESILNEWNYVKDWTDKFVYSLNAIHGIKGAVFTLSCICAAQNSPIDMLMYYDTRPSAFNGAFDYYTYEKLKGYYALYWYGMCYDLEKEIKAENEIDNIYSLCGTSKDGKAMLIITCYSDDDTYAGRDILIDLGKNGLYDVYLLDAEHDGEFCKTTDCLEFSMKNHSALLIKEK